MVCSQNVAFSGKAPTHEDDGWAPGYPITQLLSQHLRAQRWQVSEVEAWRGGGWSFTCKAAGEEVDVHLAGGSESRWMLQITPTYCPGWIGTLMRKLPSATADTCYSLAQSIHSALSSAGAYSDFRWRWNGDPYGDVATQEPTRLEGTS